MSPRLRLSTADGFIWHALLMAEGLLESNLGVCTIGLFVWHRPYRGCSRHAPTPRKEDAQASKKNLDYVRIRRS